MHINEYKISNIISEKLINYASIVAEWNDKVNLTGLKDPRRIFEELVMDTVCGWSEAKKILKIDAKKVLDLGAGGGIAGIPIGIIEEHPRVVLLESSRKKAFVLENIIQSLGLGNFAVVNQRAENAAKSVDFTGSFDLVVAKAVAEMTKLVKLSLPFIKPGGLLLAYKSNEYQDELSAAANTIASFNAKIQGVIEYEAGGTRKYIVAVKRCFT